MGADPNSKAHATGWTAMHAAAKRGDFRILQLLLQHGGKQDLRATHRDYGHNLTVKDMVKAANSDDVNKKKKIMKLFK